MQSKQNVLLNVHEKANLKAVLNHVKGQANSSDITWNRLFTQAMCNIETGPSVDSDSAFQISVIIVTDAKGRELSKMSSSSEGEAIQPSYQQVALDEDAMLQLMTSHQFMNHDWVLQRHNGEKWPCNLVGDRGVSRLLFSAAMHYLLNVGFKVVNDNDVFDMERRTKRIDAGDYIEFYLIRVVLYPNYQYSKGKAYCRKVKINFTANSVSSGPVEELEVKDLELERDINLDELDYSLEVDQNQIEYDEDEYEQDEYNHDDRERG